MSKQFEGVKIEAKFNSQNQADKSGRGFFLSVSAVVFNKDERDLAEQLIAFAKKVYNGQSV